MNTRVVQPWGLASWHGRWYLTGFDLDRQAPRVFRLSRIDGDVTEVKKAEPYAVPADHRAQEMIASSVGEQPTRDAVVRVRAERGNTLRRRATSTTDLGEWSELVVPFGDDDALADEVVRLRRRRRRHLAARGARAGRAAAPRCAGGARREARHDAARGRPGPCPRRPPTGWRGS